MSGTLRDFANEMHRKLEMSGQLAKEIVRLQELLAAAKAENEQLHHEISFYESLTNNDDEADWPHRDGRYRDWLMKKLREIERLRKELTERIEDDGDTWHDATKRCEKEIERLNKLLSIAGIDTARAAAAERDGTCCGGIVK